MRIKKHFKRSIRCCWLATKCSRLCTNGAASGSQQNPVAKGVSSLPTKHQETSCSPHSWSDRERHWGSQGSNQGVTFWHYREHSLYLCYFWAQALTFLFPRKPRLVKCCHFRCECWVGRGGRRKGKLFKSEPVGRKGKTTPADISGEVPNCQPNHQAVYPYAFLFETFYSFPLPDSNSLQGFITFT